MTGLGTLPPLWPSLWGTPDTRLMKDSNRGAGIRISQKGRQVFDEAST